MRAAKILVKCCLCNRWKGRNFYHERARGFVCKRCLEFLEKNPHFKNLPFKGWGFHPPKEKKDA